jgi:hypothetical protein
VGELGAHGCPTSRKLTRPKPERVWTAGTKTTRNAPRPSPGFGVRELYRLRRLMPGRPPEITRTRGSVFRCRFRSWWRAPFGRRISAWSARDERGGRPNSSRRSDFAVRTLKRRPQTQRDSALSVSHPHCQQILVQGRRFRFIVYIWVKACIGACEKCLKRTRLRRPTTLEPL